MPSTHEEVAEVSFEDVAPLPKQIKTDSHPTISRKKQNSTISTPLKNELEENDRKRKARKEKQILKKQKSKAKNKKEAKRKLFQESSSEEEEAYEECDDDMDDMVPSIIEEELNEGETCLICAELGKNEIWYRCIGCGGWIHKLCSGYDKPDNYICDFCK